MRCLIVLVVCLFSSIAGAQALPAGRPFALGGSAQLSIDPATITGTCATVGGVAYFTSAQVIACSAALVEDPTAGTLTLTLNQNGATKSIIVNGTNAASSVAEFRAGSSSAGSDYNTMGYGAASNSAPEFADRAYFSAGSTTQGISEVVGDATKDLRWYFGSPPSAIEAGRLTKLVLSLGSGNGATGSHAFTIVGDSASFFSATTSSASASPDVELYRSRGTTAAPSAVQSGDELGSIYFGGYGTSYTARSRIVAKATQTWSGTAAGNSVSITGAKNSTTTQVTRITFDQQGDTILGDGTSAGTGHLVSDGASPSINAASDCTATSLAGSSTDVAGTIVLTCSVGQQVQLDFAVPYTSQPPKCSITAADPDAITDAFYISGRATTRINVQAAVGSANSAQIDYLCIESR